MTIETPASQATDVALERERERVAKTRRFLNRLIWALAIVLAGTIAVLAGTLAESYRNARREAAIFASISAAAFRDGFCDRALRFAVAGLPPSTGSLPLSFQPRQLQGDLSFFASARDCYFRLALAGHTALVSGAAFSPDGSRVVTASWDGTARVWDAKTGGVLITLAGHRSWADSAVFSPDGGRILTASWDKTARVWDAKTGAVLATFSGHADHVNGAAFSPDGSRVITAGNDNTARIWDAKTGDGAGHAVGTCGAA